MAKKTNPLISIIIPIYNVEKYLPACLKSIANQSYQNLEVILIDDGSTDGSAQIAKDFTKTDPRFKYHHQKNQGLSAARNAGLKKTTGNYFTFVDSDDRIEPDMLKTMLTALHENHADIAACSFKEIYPHGKITHFNHGHQQQVFTPLEALSAMLGEQGFMVSATMKLFARHTFENVKFPVDKLHEDVGTTYKAIMQASKIVFLPDEFYLYYHHANSITQHFDERKMDLLYLTDQMCDDIDAKYPELKNITKERRMRARFSILRQIPLKNRRTSEIIRYLKQHQNYIAKNPEATRADKLALRLALISPKLFQLAYKLFKV